MCTKPGTNTACFACAGLDLKIMAALSRGGAFFLIPSGQSLLPDPIDLQDYSCQVVYL